MCDINKLQEINYILSIDIEYSDIFYELYSKDDDTKFDEDEVKSKFTEKNKYYLASKYVLHPYCGPIYLIDKYLSVTFAIFLMKLGSPAPQYPAYIINKFIIRNEQDDETFVEYIDLCYKRSGKFIRIKDLPYDKKYFPKKSLKMLIECICDKTHSTRTYNYLGEAPFSVSSYNKYYQNIVDLFVDIEKPYLFDYSINIVNTCLTSEELKNLRFESRYLNTEPVKNYNLLFQLAAEYMPVKSIKYLINNGLDLNEVANDGKNLEGFVRYRHPQLYNDKEKLEKRILDLKSIGMK